MTILTTTALTACHAAVGPVFGVALASSEHPKARFIAGWEAGGGYGPAKVNIGGSYRILETEAAASRVHYAVFEPGVTWSTGSSPRLAPVSAGVTVGALADGADHPGFVWGAFAAVTGALEETDCASGGELASDDGAALGSVAVGVRVMAGQVEIYATPKIGTVEECPSFH